VDVQEINVLSNGEKIKNPFSPMFVFSQQILGIVASQIKIERILFFVAILIDLRNITYN
jgi:hypothetical protein